jgi:hypothetical protein
MKDSRLRRTAGPSLAFAVLMVLLLTALPAMAKQQAAPARQAAVTTDRVFAGLMPAADSPGRAMLLELKADGSAVWETDYLNEAPIVVENGAWVEADDLITVTMTEQNGKKYDKPAVTEFMVEGARLIEKVDEGAVPTKLVLVPTALLQTIETRRALIDLDLAAGFALDPFFVSVNGGGHLDASTLAENCTGFVHANPVLSLDWEGKTDLARIFVYSDGDPTLLIQKPDGSYVCNNDAHEMLLDPVILLAEPATGRYNIWVGSHHQGDLIPAVLVLTTRPDVNLGTFELGALITRPPMPETVEPERSVDGDTLTEAPAAKLLAAAKVAGVAPVKQSITSEGTIGLFDVEVGNPACIGWVNEEPDYTFDWTGGSDQLSIFFDGKADAALLVVGPEDEVLCVDDAAPGKNLNPLVRIQDPTEGQWRVWVSRLNPEKALVGDLVVSGAADAAPALLAPGRR